MRESSESLGGETDHCESKSETVIEWKGVGNALALEKGSYWSSSSSSSGRTNERRDELGVIALGAEVD